MNSKDIDSSDEFEELLGSLSIVEPSEEYRNIITAISEKSKKPLFTGNRSFYGYALAFSFLLVAIVGISLVLSTDKLPSYSLDVTGFTSFDEQSPPLVDSTLEPPYLAGTHYTVMEGNGLFGAQSHGDIEVFFSYPCFPCYEFDEILEEWRSTSSTELQVVYVPAIWSDRMRHYAQVYYTAESLGVQLRSHRLLFEAIHNDNAPPDELPALLDFFSSLGVSQQRFLSIFNSEATLNRVIEAERVNQEYMIRSAPALVVGCRFLVTPNTEVGQREIIDVAQYLVEKQNAEGNKLC